jgi:hypothetical protein
MSANAVTSPVDWSKSTDEEGNETYTVLWRVETTATADGPDVAWTAAGLPIPGSALSIGNTINPWAFYQGKGDAKLTRLEASRKIWDLTTVFSTKPSKRCQDSRVSDPLLEPHRVKGSFAQVMEETRTDKNGSPLQNTVLEPYTGPECQFAACRPVVELEMNVAWINLAWMAEYADAVNSNVQWGQAVRTIKCTVGPWERVQYGNCYYYFVVRFTFELRYETWDFQPWNRASRYVLAGKSAPWTPETDFANFKTANEENTIGMVAATTGYATTTANRLNFRIFREKDFSTVGWPATII